VPRTKDRPFDDHAPRVYGATSDVVPRSVWSRPYAAADERAIKGLVTGRYEWIGFTSVNAVRAVREKFEEFGLDARAFAGLRIAAVGGVTAGPCASGAWSPISFPRVTVRARSARGLATL